MPTQLQPLSRHPPPPARRKAPLTLLLFFQCSKPCNDDNTPTGIAVCIAWMRGAEIGHSVKCLGAGASSADAAHEALLLAANFILDHPQTPQDITNMEILSTDRQVKIGWALAAKGFNHSAAPKPLQQKLHAWAQHPLPPPTKAQLRSTSQEEAIASWRMDCWKPPSFNHRTWRWQTRQMGAFPLS
ncbi:hypothetical protein BC826DRAFT_1109755 [Russula brevipes]|nr:hypothetical protein BC826DRAFT_1109755 [Russula brevipes]